jgi:hypothetical protein
MKSPWAIVAVGAIALGAAISFLSSDSSTGPTGPVLTRNPEGIWQELQGIAKRKHATASAAQSRSPFRVLRQRAITVPGQVAEKIEESLGAPPGALRTAEGYYARTVSGALWIVRGQELLCLLQVGRGALSCGISEITARHGLTLSVFDAPQYSGDTLHRFLMFGIAPDGVRSVSVQTEKGRQRIRVKHNIYAAHANHPIRLLGFRS